LSCEVESMLPVRGIDLHSPRPSVELMARGIAKECCDVGERHPACRSASINFAARN